MSDVWCQGRSKEGILKKDPSAVPGGFSQAFGVLVFHLMPSEKVCNFRRVEIRIPEKLLAVGRPLP
jgi:hypothetical protein